MFSFSFSHTNWLNALRRSYNRRVNLRQDNPFYQYLVVPDSVVRKELEVERLAKEGGGGSEGGVEGVNDDEDDDEEEERRRKGIFTESEEKLRAAEGKKPLKQKEKKPSSLVVKEEGSADINMSGTTAEARVPLQEKAIDDGFNAEMADVIAEDAAKDAATNQLESNLSSSSDNQTLKKEEEGEGENGNGGTKEEEETFWEEQRAVEWKDLSLETKIDAIYNVCEWHMVDPDKQFRKYLSFDGESAWVSTKKPLSQLLSFVVAEVDPFRLGEWGDSRVAATRSNRTRLFPKLLLPPF